MASLIEELIAKQSQRQAPQAVQSDIGGMLGMLSQGMNAGQSNLNVASVLNNQAPVAQAAPLPAMGNMGSGIGKTLISSMLGDYMDEKKLEKATETEQANTKSQADFISKIPKNLSPMERALTFLQSPFADLRKIGSEGIADITKQEIKPKDAAAIKMFEGGAQNDPTMRQQYMLGPDNAPIALGPAWKQGSGVTVVTGDQNSQYRPFNAQDEAMYGSPGPGKVGMIGPKGKPEFMDTGQQITPKPSQAQNSIIMGADNTNKAADNYLKTLDTVKIEDSLSPNRRAKIMSQYSNMILQAKEAYNLGVLNPNDRVILEEIVKNPVSLEGSILDKETLKN